MSCVSRKGHTQRSEERLSLTLSCVHGAGTPVVVNYLVIANLELGWDVEENLDLDQRGCYLYSEVKPL